MIVQEALGRHAYWTITQLSERLLRVLHTFYCLMVITHQHFFGLKVPLTPDYQTGSLNARELEENETKRKCIRWRFSSMSTCTAAYEKKIVTGSFYNRCSLYSCFKMFKFVLIQSNDNWLNIYYSWVMMSWQ